MPCKVLAIRVSVLLRILHVFALQQPDLIPSRRGALYRMATTTVGLVSASALIPAIPGYADPGFAEERGRSIVVPGGVAPYRPQGIGSWKDIPSLTTKLGNSRILASELSPLQQAFLGEKELYYPQFLFGAWNVTAELKRKIYPYGVDYLPSKSLLEGSPRNREELVGNVCNYEVHYFPTLANTLANQAVVNLGTGVPDSKIIQDRAYNAKSISKAYDQLVPVQDVTWDYRNNPEKVVLDFGAAPLAADMRPLGSRRAEIFLNARATEVGPDDRHYATAERSRSVTVAVRDVVVADTETITEFEKVSDDQVRAVSRIAVYLSPNPNSREGVLWQQTGGKAVAFFDYDLNMNRIKEDITLSDGSIESHACVTTPKDVVQCA